MDLKEGLIDEEEYQFSKVTYSKEISELQQHLVELKAQIDEETTSMDRYSHWIYLIDKYRNIQELNKEVVEAFVQNIKLYENKRIDITLNYMDEFKAAKDIYKKRRREVA
jgi:hypothetical protein